MYKYRTKKSAAKPAKLVAADVAWAAAFEALTKNGEYLKESRTDYDDNGQAVRVRKTNRELMFELIEAQGNISAEARERAVEGREWLRNQLLMRALMRGSLNSFEQSANEVIDKDQFDVNNDRYHLAILASLPSAVVRGLNEEAQRQKLHSCNSSHVAAVGDRVEISVEIVLSFYSHKYNTHFITAITDSNQQVFFSYRSNLTQGSKCKIKGTVKNHRSDSTQLNRVRIVE